MNFRLRLWKGNIFINPKNSKIKNNVGVHDISACIGRTWARCTSAPPSHLSKNCSLLWRRGKVELDAGSIVSHALQHKQCAATPFYHCDCPGDLLPWRFACPDCFEGADPCQGEQLPWRLNEVSQLIASSRTPPRVIQQSIPVWNGSICSAETPPAVGTECDYNSSTSIMVGCKDVSQNVWAVENCHHYKWKQAQNHSSWGYP